VPHLALRNLKTATRLTLGFGLVTALLVVIAVLGWTSNSSARSNDRATNASIVNSAPDLALAIDALHIGLDENSVAGDYLAHAPAAGDLASFKADSQSFLSAYRSAHASGPYDAPRRAAELAAYNTYEATSNEANAQFAAGRYAKAESLIGQLSVGSIYTPAMQVLTHQDNQTVHANDSAMSSANTNRTVALIIGLVALAVAIGLALAIMRSITRPLKEAKRVLDLSAGGDLRVRADIDSTDEIGDMAKSLNHQLEARQGLLRQIGEMARALTSASDELSSISSQLASGSEEASVQATAVSAAAEQVSANVGSVAAAAEEFSASIGEIARSAGDASRVASDGVDVTRATNDTVSQLSDSSNKIGEVVQLIASIAQQTNLLALNATIEAARAGEAGRGFAIVANEVKELAKQTASATDEISRTVEAIQGDSQAAIEAITQIDEIMAKVSAAQTAIASAVEEQTATTSEIGRTVNEAASGSGEIARNIAGVATAAQQTTVAASSTLQASGELSRMANNLEGLLVGYQF
jgi:methyl-accepting chemotaxis protein